MLSKSGPSTDPCPTPDTTPWKDLFDSNFRVVTGYDLVVLSQPFCMFLNMSQNECCLYATTDFSNYRLLRKNYRQCLISCALYRTSAKY